MIRDNYYPNDEIKERNTKVIANDYVKFFRFYQYNIDVTASAFLDALPITDSSTTPLFEECEKACYIPFPPFRLLDLHGNVRKKETSLDEGKDRNVFNIQQGIAITIASKHSDGKAQAFHADIYDTSANPKKTLSKTQQTQNTVKPNLPNHSNYSSRKIVNCKMNMKRVGKSSKFLDRITHALLPAKTG